MGDMRPVICAPAPRARRVLSVERCRTGRPARFRCADAGAMSDSSCPCSTPSAAWHGPSPHRSTGAVRTSVLSRKQLHEMKPMNTRPGQGANRSDSLCYREDLQRRHGCEDAVSYASYLQDRTLAGHLRHVQAHVRHFQHRAHRQQARVASVHMTADRQQSLGHRPVSASWRRCMHRRPPKMCCAAVSPDPFLPP